MADSVGAGFPSTGIQKGHLFHDLDNSTLWEFLGGTPPQAVANWKLLDGVLTAQPDTSLWGLSQAGASWILNGIMYGWDGVQIVEITNGAPVSLYNYRNSVRVQDDFISGLTSNGNGGDLGFGFTNGTTTQIPSETNYPGIFRRDTSAVINTVTTVNLGINNNGIIPIRSIAKIVFIFRSNNNDADTLIRIGSSDSFSSNPAVNGIYFEKLGPDTNWFAVLRLGAVSIRVDTGISVNVNFNVFEVMQDGVSAKFSINGVLVATMTTGYPVAAILNPFVHAVNLVAASKTYDVDYFELDISNIVR